MQDDLSDQQCSGQPRRAQAKSQMAPSKWLGLFLTLFVGYPFAAMGVYAIVNGVSDLGHGLKGGYEDLLLGAFMADLGILLGVTPWLKTGGRYLVLATTFLWHVAGIYTFWRCLALASQPFDLSVFFLIGLYEWAGLLPLVLLYGMSEKTQRGLPKWFLSCVTWLWVGGLVGGAAGALLGFAAGLVLAKIGELLGGETCDE